MPSDKGGSWHIMPPPPDGSWDNVYENLGKPAVLPAYH